MNVTNVKLRNLSIKLFSKSKAIRHGAAASVLLFPAFAFAGTDTTFDTVYTQFTGWTQGSLGRLITLAMIVVGLIGGIARQSLIAFAIGVGGGIGLYNSSTIVGTLFGATI